MLTIGEVREKLKYIKQSVLVLESGVPRQTLHNIANMGTCNAETLEKISAAIEKIEGKRE